MRLMATVAVCALFVTAVAGAEASVGMENQRQNR
jgi:NADH:ubiquinone oxidoreductase subunit K